MRTMLAISQRELASLFYSPMGYSVLAGFLLLTGVIVLVTDSLGTGKPASLRGVFDFAPYILTIIIPAITMRTLSDEYRNGTIESLMTAPISDTQMVVGKYLATVIFYAIMLACTLIYLVILMWGTYPATPDKMASLASYLGLFLLGVAFLAIGVFSSSLSKNQIVAWIICVVPLMLFVWFAAYITRVVEGRQRDAFQSFNILRLLDQFNRGLITTESVVFLLGTAALFLFLAVKVVESKRWR